ncbi:RNA 2',3'-cyclic phosphodiesterase [Phytoactinopolyspora endophytica]|uniref:RNA 2',3'-cyclic phosphodiesterase n=1 Tax=Phytoactinopolyspora endophytica TaxID=1642495 RepID=UPI00101D7B0F|nr:RNA 2',3'-cyclic phosphodiesterase [Phytoactinopolyspora endophytica]
MRLFAAIVPPVEVVGHLDEALRAVRDDDLNWTLPTAMHITLAFYGEVGEKATADLTTRLARAAGRRTKMELRITGAGRFGRAVLWVGVQGDTEPLRGLALSAVAAGRRIGVDREPARTFRPHITIARARQNDDLRPYAAALEGYAGPAWYAEEMALVRSQLRGGPGGRARYERITSFPFASA